jgi:hypothetical protein
MWPDLTEGRACAAPGAAGTGIAIDLAGSTPPAMNTASTSHRPVPAGVFNIFPVSGQVFGARMVYIGER